ncbi:neuroendocrine convertase 1-like [Babylonia areolata]|uniref:neuroendocrine convertase 1-like n=1 Tax=Babylonia areolata TaxID=304850 RepID=UPI003FCFE18E
MTSCVFLWLVVLAYHGSSLGLKSEDHFVNEWAAHIPGGLEHARDVAEQHSFGLVGPIENFADYYILRRHDVPGRCRRSAHHHTRRLVEDGQVTWAEQQVARSRVKRGVDDDNVHRAGRTSFNDPYYKDEWYLEESDARLNEREQAVHLNLRVRGAWERGLTGKGVVVSVLDDGIEHTNRDLKENYDPYASTDLNDGDADPTPRYEPTNENKHGTRCAGEIAMVANNGKCGVGIAYNCKIGGVRMLDGKVTDSLEARALSFNFTHIDIYSASWGPNDDGTTLEGPGKLASTALEKGVTLGRGGKGVIYAWASGNGGRMKDNCNCDGYTSSIYTLSVSSASERGRLPWYSEKCSSTFASTYSSGNSGDHQVVSADLHDSCTTRHTGTSASAPMAAGIFALVLEANPDITWRDLQHLVAMTSKVGPLAEEDGWYQNAAGFCVNLAFGFGLLDATDLVIEAHPDTWVNVPEKSVCEITADSFSNVPQNLTSGHVVEVLIETNGCRGQPNEVNFLEHVQFVLTLSYSKRGDISVVAVSPSGTETTLMRPREWDKSRSGFQQWPLMSVHTWGEDPKGVWRFRVQDTNPSGSNYGQLEDLKLVLHGTKEAPHYHRKGQHQCDVRLKQPTTTTTTTTPSPQTGMESGMQRPASRPKHGVSEDVVDILQAFLDRQKAADKAEQSAGDDAPYYYL